MNLALLLEGWAESGVAAMVKWPNVASLPLNLMLQSVDGVLILSWGLEAAEALTGQYGRGLPCRLTRAYRKGPGLA